MKLILSLIGCCVSIMSFSQDSLRKPVIGFYENVVFVSGDFSRINEVLNQSGYPSLSSVYGGISMGTFTRSPQRDSYSSAHLDLLFNSTGIDSITGKRASIILLGLAASYHFDFIPSRKWMAYPYGGWGLNFNWFTLRDMSPLPTSFASSISNLSSGTEKKAFISAAAFINAGVGAEYRFKISHLYLSIGGGIGYRLSTRVRYSASPQSAIYSPSVRLSGIETNFRVRLERGALTRNTKIQR